MILAALLLLLTAGFAGTTSSALYTKLQGAYKNLSSFQADVQQANYYAQLKKTITYSGTIYFTPGRMLMHFTKPTLQRLKIESGRVELYDASSNSLFKSEVLPEFGKMNPVEILQLYWGKSSVSVTAEDDVSASVRLTPTKDDLVSTLTARISKGNGMVTKLGYTDKNGNTVSYAFSGIKLNAGIASSVWQYSYPKNVQVVEQ